ncbi:MAG: hypothetical protein ACRCTS_01690 [Fusobacteriaceae bacterium]
MTIREYWVIDYYEVMEHQDRQWLLGKPKQMRFRGFQVVRNGNCETKACAYIAIFRSNSFSVNFAKFRTKRELDMFMLNPENEILDYKKIDGYKYQLDHTVKIDESVFLENKTTGQG